MEGKSAQVYYMIRYIMNQEAHHAKKSFKQEYLDLLRENDVEFDERYLFEDPE